MALSKNFVFKKLEMLDEHNEELKKLLEEAKDETFFSDSGKMHIAKRLTQLTIDTMIDINQHLIKELNLSLSDDLQAQNK